jgi:copper chaperone NosL
MRSELVTVVAACGLASGGCGADTSRPPSIRYGEEACARCRMIISDDRFAAALVTRGGEAMKFDDVGCLVEYEAGRPTSPAAAAAYWVRDYTGGGWLDARAATFVRSPQAHSPMAYGLTAIPPNSPAAGPALRFDQLPSAIAASRGEPGTPGPTPR